MHTLHTRVHHRLSRSTVHIVKAMVFPVVMYECESWTIKKAERRRIDAFELWCWRRLLRVPWTARRSKQSILKEISPEDSLEGLVLKLKLQYFGHLMQRTDSLEKTLMLGGIGGRRRRGRQRRRWLDGITDSMGVGLSSSGRCDGQGAWHAATRGVAKCWTWLSNWTTTKPAWSQSHDWGRGALLSPSLHSFCFKENQMLCQAGKTSCWGALCPLPPCLMVEWTVLVERPGLPLVSFVFGRKGDEVSEQAVHLQWWLKGVGLWFRTKQWAAQRARKGLCSEMPIRWVHTWCEVWGGGQKFRQPKWRQPGHLEQNEDRARALRKST